MLTVLKRIISDRFENGDAGSFKDSNVFLVDEKLSKRRRNCIVIV